MAERRDVILVTVDSLRADHCGFMGYDRDVTPTLDRLAANGLVFETAIAPAGSTGGSVPAFFTGEHLVDPALLPGDPGKDEWIRSHLAARETLPERLSRQGYETAAFTANPWTSRHFGFDRGFDHFEDFMDDAVSGGVLGDGLARRSGAVALLSQALNWWRGQDMFMAWEAFYDDVVAWLDRAERPYFLWVFLVDAHVPYLPGTGYRSQSRLLTYPANASLFAGREPADGSWLHRTLRQAYDDTIRYTDAFLDRLVGDLTDDPLVVFHADHGELLGEHGTYGHGTTYEENIHVPLVVHNGPSGRVTEPFSLLELPDLIEALSTGEGYDHLASPYARSRNYDPTLAIRGAGWKYVRRPDGADLFGIADGERTPLADGALAELGRDLVADWLAHDREKARLKDAAGTVAATEPI